MKNKALVIYFLSALVLLITFNSVSAITKEYIPTSGADNTELLWDDFEDYTYTSGLELYAEMTAHGWYVYDYTHPWPDDDIYLEQNGDNHYVVIRDHSYIAALIDTTGYKNIIVSYDRRSYELEPWEGDGLRVEWRVGYSGEWTLLEKTDDTTWEHKVWKLPSSANNQELIQVRFIIRAFRDYKTDFGHMDNFLTKGNEISGNSNYDVNLDLTMECGELIKRPIFS